MKQIEERPILDRLNDFIEFADATNKKSDVAFYREVQEHILKLESELTTCKAFHTVAVGQRDRNQTEYDLLVDELKMVVKQREGSGEHIVILTSDFREILEKLKGVDDVQS